MCRPGAEGVRRGGGGTDGGIRRVALWGGCTLFRIISMRLAAEDSGFCCSSAGIGPVPIPELGSFGGVRGPECTGTNTELRDPVRAVLRKCWSGRFCAYPNAAPASPAPKLS